MVSPEEVRMRVLAGAAWLDNQMGGAWDACVDVDTLVLSHCQRCVLGQLYGDFEHAMTLEGLSDDDARHYGFVLSPYSPDADHRISEYPTAYHLLTEVWLQVITERRQARAVLTVEPERELVGA